MASLFAREKHALFCCLFDSPDNLSASQGCQKGFGYSYWGQVFLRWPASDWEFITPVGICMWVWRERLAEFQNGQDYDGCFYNGDSKADTFIQNTRQHWSGCTKSKYKQHRINPVTPSRWNQSSVVPTDRRLKQQNRVTRVQVTYELLCHSQTYLWR